MVFGDSLSDNGNLAPLLTLAGVPIPNPSPPYFGGPNNRFSNGPVWVEQLFGPLNRPTVLPLPVGSTTFLGPMTGNIDLAFGGARTDTLVPIPPGIPTQIAGFQSAGGTFGANDTVVIWGGANNAFQFIAPGVTQAGITADAISAASSNIGSIGTVAAAGPGRILVANLPNLGALPAYTQPPTGSAAASQGAFLYSQVYNQAQSAGTQQVARANPGVNIIQMDVDTALSIVQANPTAFGFTNVTQACLLTPACAAGTTAQQNKFLFFDPVHPTQAGHALLAQYAGLLLDTRPAQARTTALAEAPIWANQQAVNSIFDRMQGFINSQYAKKNGLHADVLGAIGSQDARGLAPSYDYNLYGVRGGLDKKYGSSLYGLSVTVLMGDLSGGGLNADTATFQGDLYGSWSIGQMFINANIGGGLTHISNIHRATGFPTVQTTGNVNNLEGHGGLQAGMVAQLGPITIMPSGRVQAIQSYLDNYDETAPLLALEFDKRNTTAVLAGASLRASVNAGAMTVFAEVGYEDYLSYDADRITAKLVDWPDVYQCKYWWWPDPYLQYPPRHWLPDGANHRQCQ